MLSKNETNLLLRLVQQRPAERAVSALASKLANEHGIGHQGAQKIIYLDRHFEAAAALLRLYRIDPTTPAEAWAGAGRTQAAALQGNEKWATQPVGTGLVAIKAMQGLPLLLGGQDVTLPVEAHLVVPVEVVHVESLHRLVVVENFEPFRLTHQWRRDLLPIQQGTLFVYRGDAAGGGRADAVNALIEVLCAKTPHAQILAAFDLDPAGLGMASTLPRLDGFIAPGAKETLKRHGRSDLYRQQYAQWARHLDACSHPAIAATWSVMRSLATGAPQEAFMAEPLAKK